MLGSAATGTFRHRQGRAILERAASDVIPLRPAKDPSAMPGKGVEATLNGKRVYIGCPSMPHGSPHFQPTRPSW